MTMRKLERRRTGRQAGHDPKLSLTTAARHAWRRVRATGEDGWTAIEILVTLLVMSVLFTVTVPTVTIFLGLQRQVSTTYTGADQELLVSDVLARYFRAAVEPAPETDASGFAPFIVASSTELEFTANLGNSNGPDEVLAQVTGTSPNQILQISVASPMAGTCPTSVTSTAKCTWSTTFRNMATLQYVSTTAPFTYIPIAAPTCTANAETTPFNLVSKPLEPWPPSPTVTYPCGGTDTTANPWTTTPTTSWTWIANPLDDIWGVKVDLKTVPPGGQASAMKTMVFLASTSSYLFSASVG